MFMEEGQGKNLFSILLLQGISWVFRSIALQSRQRCFRQRFASLISHWCCRQLYVGSPVLPCRASPFLMVCCVGKGTSPWRETSSMRCASHSSLVCLCWFSIKKKKKQRKVKGSKELKATWCTSSNTSMQKYTCMRTGLDTKRSHSDEFLCCLNYELTVPPHILKQCSSVEKSHSKSFHISLCFDFTGYSYS